MSENRKLIDLVSVGKATLEDFEYLGITEIEQLKDKDAGELLEQLQKIKGSTQNICCEDVFRCAIEQARDPELPNKKKQWFYWSKVRKGLI